MEKYKYNDVIVTPYYTPKNHWLFPSLIGFVSIDKTYCEHCGGSPRLISKTAFTTRYEHIVIKPCIFGGFFFQHYGHFVLESLSRLYFIKTLPSEYDIIIPYNNLGNEKLLRYQTELLSLLGIKNNIKFLKEPTLFKTLYTPPPGATLSGFLSSQQLDALGVVENRIENGKKLYISRSAIRGRGCKNEKEIENILIKRGWTVIHPEKLTISEQLFHLSSAETVFCINGSALYSLLFLKNPAQRFIVIPRNHVGIYNILGRVKAKDYWLLQVKKNDMQNAEKDESMHIFSLDVNYINDMLEKSSDFYNLEPIKNNLKKPDIKELNYMALPRYARTTKRKSEVHDNLFYRILVSEYNGTHIFQALKILYVLIWKDLFKAYMVPKSTDFIEKYFSNLKGVFVTYCALKFSNIKKNELDTAFKNILTEFRTALDNEQQKEFKENSKKYNSKISEYRRIIKKIESEKADLKCKLIELKEENSKLKLLIASHKNIQDVQSRNALNVRLGNMLIEGACSRLGLVGLPARIGKLWFALMRSSPPASLGGKSFRHLLHAYDMGGDQEVEKLLDSTFLASTMRADAYTAVARHVMDQDKGKAVFYARLAWETDPRPFRLKWLIFRLYEARDFVKADILLDMLPPDLPFTPSDKREAKIIRQEAKKLNHTRAYSDLKF